MRLISWEKKGRDYILEVEYRPFLFMPKVTKKVRGNCTIWHECPSGRWVSTYMEYDLYSIWLRVKWQEENKEADSAP